MSNEQIDIFIEYFPIIKWVVGGMMGIIMLLGGILWKRLANQIMDLELAVSQISKDTIKHVTHDEFDDFKLHIDRKFDDTTKVLMDHNRSVNDKLDALVLHLLKHKSG